MPVRAYADLMGAGCTSWTRMALVRTTLALTLAALMLAPAAAFAHPHAQPLVDAKPFGGSFKDRVTSSNPRVARVASTAKFSLYTTADGTNIPVAISDQYGGNISPTVAQSYVDFIDSLDHGPELAQLKIYIAPPAEVQQNCGGQDGTLACYDSSTQIMNVPGEAIQSDGGVTTSYVVAHEYGHHIATFRSNAPFRSFTFGPKFWSSYELVCDRTNAGLLAPGDEGQFYLANPGEAWADTYAHLKYPDVDWQYTPLLRPDQGAFDAARKDVMTPWPGLTTTTFNGTFKKRGRNTRTFAFLQRLDGTINVKLSGP